MKTSEYQWVNYSKINSVNHQPLCVYILFIFIESFHRTMRSYKYCKNIDAVERHNNKIAESSGWASM